MKIVMIGLGKLGLPCAEVMSTYYETYGYDIDSKIQSNKLTLCKNIQEAVAGKDIIFIAVPTPHHKEYDGSSPIADLPPKDFDYTIVKKVITEINQYTNSNQLIVLISTVLPGTTRGEIQKLITTGKLLYNPYLIAMGSVSWDMEYPECLIIGSEHGELSDEVQTLLDFYKPIVKNNCNINIGTYDEAEAIKIFYNTFISAKIGLVNMIQDVAEKNGNINVDIVTNALKFATDRIVSSKYLTAGMGDAGPCHPRDNIALRYLANKLDLGYDLFHAIMHSRDKQAENLAEKLICLSKQYSLPIIIHGRAYKPGVPLVEGSYSELVAHYVRNKGVTVNFADPLTNDTINDNTSGIILLAHNSGITYYGTELKQEQKFYFKFGDGSVILDPWRTVLDIQNCTVLHYGNTRF